MAPAPRRVRVILDGRVVVDTCAATNVSEHPRYPRYYVPLADIGADALVDQQAWVQTQLGPGPSASS